MGDRLARARRIGAAVLAVIALAMVGAGCGGEKDEDVVYRDVFKVLTDTGLKLPATGDPAPVLAGPHFKIRLTGRQIAARSREFAFLMREHLATGRAAAGSELVLIRLEGPASGSPSSKADAEPVRARVSAGATVMDIPTPQPQGGTLLAMVAPVGAPLTLTVTDDGRDQSLDLRTGTPGADAAAEFRQPTAQTLSGATTVNGTVSAFGVSRPYTIVLTPRTADRVVYRPDLKWAPQGRAWLSISLGFTSNSLMVDGQLVKVPFYLRQSLDLPTALVLTLPDGTRVPAMAGTYVYDPTTLRDILLNGHFDVPAGTRTGTVTVTLGGTVTADAGSTADGRPNRTQRVRYTPTPATVTVAVALPA